MSTQKWLTGYYGATLLFVLLDSFVSINIRAAFLEPWPVARVAYYAFAVGCWFAMRRHPRWTPLIGIGESSVSLFLLIWSVMGASAMASTPAAPTKSCECAGARARSSTAAARS